MLAVPFGSREREISILIEAGRAGSIWIYCGLVGLPTYPKTSPGGPVARPPTPKKTPEIEFPETLGGRALFGVPGILWKHGPVKNSDNRR